MIDWRNLSFQFMGVKIVFVSIYCQREFLYSVNFFLRRWLSGEFIFKFVTRWLSSVVWRLHFVLQLTKIVNGFDDFYNSKLHLVIPRCMRISRKVIGEKNFLLSFFLPRYTSQAADTVTGTVQLDCVWHCDFVSHCWEKFPADL